MKNLTIRHLRPRLSWGGDNSPMVRGVGPGRKWSEYSVALDIYYGIAHIL